ncbi:MAG TPA: hypothetical protein VN618_09865 [Solirubrobacteraceae bacterium]|nr:hypothetical protein [Solirubrobacteraceae bacterium]
MTLPTKPRPSVRALALPVLAAILCAAATPAAASPESRAERHAQRAEERAARHAQRLQEREARRAERLTRRNSSSTGEGTDKSEGASNTASPHADRGCTLTLSASSTHVLAGETVTLTGSVGCPAPGAAAGLSVSIYARGDAPAEPAAAQALAPAADGTFTYTSAPLERDTVFLAREGRHRARVSVRVAPGITLALAPAASGAAGSATAKPRREHAIFTGTVTPAPAHALVALQIHEGSRWRSVAWAHTASDGSYALAHSFRSPGALELRAIAHTGRGHSLAISEPLDYEAAQPQNAKLTIESSADPATAGQPVTISGVAAGASAGTAVKLFGRTRGGLFAVLAEGSTDASGAYSFSVAPMTDTIYRVTVAAARSTALFERVLAAAAPSA